MNQPLFSGLTILRPPDRHLAEQLQAIIASGLPLDAAHLARILCQDAVTAAAVLKRANNAYYGLRETVSSLVHAIEILEPAHVAQMVISTSRENADSEFLQSLLRQARDTAWASHKLASGMSSDPGTEFTAGLLYNYGQVILALSFPSQAPALFASSQSTVLFDPDDWRTPEQLQFGLDAAEAGEFAARLLNLPDSLVNVMACGGHPLPMASRNAASPLARLVNRALFLGPDAPVPHGHNRSFSTNLLHRHGH